MSPSVNICNQCDVTTYLHGLGSTEVRFTIVRLGAFSASLKRAARGPAATHLLHLKFNAARNAVQTEAKHS